jgi:hypothetical protein
MHLLELFHAFHQFWGSVNAAGLGFEGLQHCFAHIGVGLQITEGLAEIFRKGLSGKSLFGFEVGVRVDGVVPQSPACAGRCD